MDWYRLSTVPLTVQFFSFFFFFFYFGFYLSSFDHQYLHFINMLSLLVVAQAKRNKKAIREPGIVIIIVFDEENIAQTTRCKVEENHLAEAAHHCNARCKNVKCNHLQVQQQSHCQKTIDVTGGDWGWQMKGRNICNRTKRWIEREREGEQEQAGTGFHVQIKSTIFNLYVYCGISLTNKYDV